MKKYAFSNENVLLWTLQWERKYFVIWAEDSSYNYDGEIMFSSI